MPQDPAHRICLATVTDDRFLPGTAVLLSSFLRHNPWFEGSVVIIHDGLARRSMRLLETFPGVEYRRVGDTLRRSLDELVGRHPRLASIRPRFHSLEAFGLSDFERVLYVDADVLCTAGARELLDLEPGLWACPDQTHLRGQVRDAVSFLPRDRDTPSSHAVLPSTFNTGLMMISPSALGDGVVEGLAHGIDPEAWSKVRSGHTDQFVLNHAFEGRWRALPSGYNHFVTPADGDYPVPREALDEAVFVHYLGRPKPWGGRAGPDWRRMTGPRREAYRRWDAARWAWAVRRMREASDPAPVIDICRRAMWRVAARLVRRRPAGPSRGQAAS